jgi:light-regulated signal transduction histidine kinase (bacteriophytochrome)
VGADGGLLADSGEVLHSVGLVEDLQNELWAELRSGHRRVVDVGAIRTAMILPWEVDSRRGGVAVLAGPFTPFLGDDEMARLDQYAAAVKTALDRVRLVESMRRSQEQLQRFNQELERRVALRTAQLEASNQELEAFSYTVSHDLRAPLRAIDGFARILQEDERPRVTEAGQHYIDMISDNAEEMGQLIDGLLTFSRLTRQEMKRQTINPADVVDPVIERLTAENPDRHIEFKVRDLPPCRSDLLLLQQVYANLLGNAVKFSRNSDPARIEVGALTQAGADGKTIYYVRDNGVGFDMKYADKLFGVFQRLHRADEFEGSGAGLAIVQRIVHRHGGEVWAQSTQGQGATFYFTLGSDLEDEEKREDEPRKAEATVVVAAAEPQSQESEATASVAGKSGD